MISEQLKQQTTGRWKDILLTMGVPSKILSGEHQACPFCGGKDRFRFTNHEGQGFYYCNQCGNGTGFDLASKFLDKSFAEVCREIEKILGGKIKMRTETADRTAEVSAVNKIWADSVELVKDDPVCQYLTGRGLKMASTTLRFHQGVFDGHSGHRLPSMIAPIMDSLDEMIGIHITHLEEGAGNCWGKSTLARSAKKQRKLKETISGGAIRLWKMDPSNLGIAEGIETALAVRELFGVNCWSVMTATGMEKFILPDPRPIQLTIYADNDRNFTGLKAAFILANRLAIKDDFFNVFVERPMATGDFLDQLNGYVTREKGPQELV